MDNLTHSLFGALIGQAGLKRTTGLAMPALIIGANIPDIDASCTIYGIESLAMRRGITHGPPAMILLPLLLAAGLWWYDRWQTKRGKRPEGRLPVRFGWLYALSLIGCLSHPALDWMNSYGVRLLEPFSSQWFYGDVLFIIDIWLLLGLGFATWLSLRREKQGGEWRKPARIALAGALAYIGMNAAVTYAAETRMRFEGHPAVAIGNPRPAMFWSREPITGHGDGFWTVGKATVGDVPLAACDLEAARRADPQVDAFLFWSRTPFVEKHDDGWVLGDARFADSLGGRDRFSVILPERTCRKSGETG